MLSEVAVGRWALVVSSGLRAYMNECRMVTVMVAAHAVNRMQTLGMTDACPHCLTSNGVGAIAPIDVFRGLFRVPGLSAV